LVLRIEIDERHQNRFGTLPPFGCHPVVTH
jgi:hypothetical protein